MKLKIKRLNEDAILPTIGTEFSAGMDLYISEDKILEPFKPVLVGTGCAFEIPENHMGMLVARSSLPKRGLMIPNCVGIIDSDYRGEVKIQLLNFTNENVKVEKGERLSQLIIVPSRVLVGGEVIDNIEEADELSDTVRGQGGFGSTGI